MAGPNLSGWTPNALTPAGKRLAYTQKRNTKATANKPHYGPVPGQSYYDPNPGQPLQQSPAPGLQRQYGNQTAPGIAPGEPALNIIKDYTSDAARNAAIAQTKLKVAELVAGGADPTWFDSITGEPVNVQGLRLLYPGMQMQGQAGSPMPGAPAGTPASGQQQLALLQNIAGRKQGTSFGRKGVANSWLQRMSDGWN